MAPINSDVLREEDILKYAELLYKCTLCTSSTSILPDQPTFIKHMRDLHLNLRLKLYCCELCGLTFATRKDLQNHNISLHEKSIGKLESVLNNKPTDIFQPIDTNISENKTPVSDRVLDAGTPPLVDQVSVNCAENPNEGVNLEDATNAFNRHALIVQSVGESKSPTKNKLCGSRLSDLKQSSCASKDKIQKNDMQKSFGKYASSILIKGEAFFYCQVCMFKTTQEEEFHVHFNGDEHMRTVQKLETPWQDVKGIWSWSGTAAAGCIAATKYNPTWCSKPAKSPICTSVANEASSVTIDLLPGLCDFEEVPNSMAAGQSNKRKQSVPVAVRRMQDMPNIDLNLEEFDENILDIEMYPECLGDSLDLHVPDQKNSTSYFDLPESEIQVKEEPSETAREKQMMKDLQYLIRNIDKTNDVPEHCVGTIIGEKMNENEEGSNNNDKVFECPVCKFQFNSIDLYTTHYRDSHLSKSGPLPAVSSSHKTISITEHSQLWKERTHAAGRKKQPQKVVQTPFGTADCTPKNLTDVLVDILPSFTEIAVAQLEYIPPERSTILKVASAILNDACVVKWKGECNRAIKKLYPNSKVKRKGPNNRKAIYYHGVKMIQEFLETSSSSKTALSPRLKTGTGNIDEPRKAAKQAKMSPFGEVRGTPVKCSSDGSDALAFQVPSEGSLSATPPVGCVTSSSVTPKSIPSSGIGSLMHLAKFITLYPGPFVTVRNVCQKYKTSTGHIPHVNTAIEAMNLLQTFGLGDFTSIDNGWTKVFFKVMPDRLTEENSSNVSVKRAVYQAIFSERDCKLDSILHGKLKKSYAEQNPGVREFYPQ